MRGEFPDDVVAGADGLDRPGWAIADPLLQDYYDTEWGMPITDEQGMFERLSLEVFQVGLSWATILRKRPAFREVFAGFDPDLVAQFEFDDVARLMADPRIIRNRGKIAATINNAEATIALRDSGGLADLIWSYKPAQTPRPQHHSEIPTQSPESVALAKHLKKLGFKFVGPVNIYATMAAVGIVDLHLVGSHRRGCSGVWPE